MDKVNFPYRSDSHLPFLHVVHESGSWAKHGLEVNYDYEITSEDSHKNVANGTVEFVGGNHLSPYILLPKGRNKGVGSLFVEGSEVLGTFSPLLC